MLGNRVIIIHILVAMYTFNVAGRQGESVLHYWPVIRMMPVCSKKSICVFHRVFIGVIHDLVMDGVLRGVHILNGELISGFLGTVYVEICAHKFLREQFTIQLVIEDSDDLSG